MTLLVLPFNYIFLHLLTLKKFPRYEIISKVGKVKKKVLITSSQPLRNISNVVIFSVAY